MNLIRQITHPDELKTVLSEFKKKDLRIGFVPTMGALHNGHFSLIEKCLQQNDICICSVFVNPTQFNDPEDYKKYPRQIGDDIKKLEDKGCDIVFTPLQEDIYPGNDLSKIIIDLGIPGSILEAAHRPGHFDGVVTVVKKMFDIVQPDAAYFGQKDFQQYHVIKKMISFYNLKIKLVLCDTLRESDGLAMSSRNMLLTENERKLAPIIFNTLSMAKKLLNEKSVEEVKEWAAKLFKSEKLINFEYFEIVDANTLIPINSIQVAEQVVICTAMKIGNIRLIDNMFVKI